MREFASPQLKTPLDEQCRNLPTTPLSSLGLLPSKATTPPAQSPLQWALTRSSLCPVMNEPLCLFIFAPKVVLHAVCHSCPGLTAAAAPVVHSVCLQLRVWGSAFLLSHSIPALASPGLSVSKRVVGISLAPTDFLRHRSFLLNRSSAFHT